MFKWIRRFNPVRWFRQRRSLAARLHYLENYVRNIDEDLDSVNDFALDIFAKARRAEDELEIHRIQTEDALLYIRDDIDYTDGALWKLESRVKDVEDDVVSLDLSIDWIEDELLIQQSGVTFGSLFGGYDTEEFDRNGGTEHVKEPDEEELGDPERELTLAGGLARLDSPS